MKIIKDEEKIFYGNSSSKKRLRYIDLLRGFGIILMIMGHIGFGDVFLKWSHSFHMQMFFLISGLFFKPTTYSEIGRKIKSKGKSLLIPYLIFGFFNYLVWLIINFINNKEQISINPLLSLAFINSSGLAISGALWFLTSLFFTETIFILLDLIKMKKVKIIIIILISLFGTFASKILPFRLPYTLDASFVGIGLYGFGYMYRKTKLWNFVLSFEKFSKTKKFLTIIFLLLVFFGLSVLSLFNKEINMREGNYQYFSIFWVISIGVSVILLIIFSLLDRYIRNYLPIYFGFVENIGKNSIIFLCLNQIVILGMNEALSLIIFNKYLNKFLVLITSLVILYYVTLLFTNTPLFLLLGKKERNNA